MRQGRPPGARGCPPAWGAVRRPKSATRGPKSGLTLHLGLGGAAGAMDAHTYICTHVHIYTHTHTHTHQLFYTRLQQQNLKRIQTKKFILTRRQAPRLSKATAAALADVKAGSCSLPNTTCRSPRTPPRPLRCPVTQPPRHGPPGSCAGSGSFRNWALTRCYACVCVCVYVCICV